MAVDFDTGLLLTWLAGCSVRHTGKEEADCSSEAGVPCSADHKVGWSHLDHTDCYLRNVDLALHIEILEARTGYSADEVGAWKILVAAAD